MQFLDFINSVYENHPNYVIGWNFIERKVVYSNKCLFADLGYVDADNNELLSYIELLNIINPSDRNEFEKVISQKEEFKNFKTYITLIDPFGRAVLLNVTAFMIKDFSDFKIIEFNKIHESNHLVEENLSDVDLDSIVSIQSDGIGIMDENENFRYANKSASMMFGCYPENLIGKNLLDFLSLDNIKLIKVETQKRKRGESSVYELQINRSDGSPCFLLVTATPKIDSRGNFIETIGVFRDITEKKKAEDELKIEQNKIKSIINSLQDLIFILDSEGYFIDYVQSDKSQLIAPPDFFIGKHLREVLPPEIVGLHEKAVKKITKTNKPANYDYPISTKDKTLWYSAQTSKITGSIFYQDLYIVVIREITHRKRNEEKLKRNALAFKRLDEDKNKLISIMAHDLKNPFSAMLGMAEMLNKFYDTFPENKKREYIQQILLSTKNIQYLLDNTLQWSLTEQKLMQFNPEPIDIHLLIEKVIVGLQVMFNQKYIRVIHSIPSKTILFCDEQMMRNIFVNLLTNSYKFSNKNGIIEINYQKNEKSTQFSVVDYGVGMSPEQVLKVFNKGSKSSKKGTQGEKGTGLGLVLCKEFIQKHNGKIWVESLQGVKTEFFFTIPNIS